MHPVGHYWVKIFVVNDTHAKKFC